MSELTKGETEIWQSNFAALHAFRSLWVLIITAK